MSDPVSSMDVEDVLSSIRRLVSEESKTAESPRESLVKRMNETSDQSSKSLEESVASMLGRSSGQKHNTIRAEGQPPSNEDIAATEMDDDATDDIAANRSPDLRSDSDADAHKLVLTAALRVKDNDDDNDEKVLPIRPVRPVRPERLHLRSIQGEADQSQPQADPEPLDPSTGSTTGTRPRGRGFVASPDELLFDRANREIEAARQNRPSEPAKSINPAPFDQPKWTAPEEAVQDQKQSPEAHADRLEASDEVPSELPHPDASPFRKEGGVFGKRLVAEPELHNATPDEPAEAGADETSATSPAEALKTDPFEAEPEAADPEESALDEPSTINFAEQDEGLLDEDALRDLVSQMVREELQGELGDRITRNVRKLVRREIQRALASREFE